MKKRILWNDIKENRLLSVSTWLFMALSGFLFALACFLFLNLLGSVDRLMEKAQTPDFLQMHAGEISEEELARFARENESVREYQTLRFLNLDNGTLSLNGHSLADSTQDNGVCVQSGKFDYLLDLENQVIEPSQGEIYVPVCCRQEYEKPLWDFQPAKSGGFYESGHSGVKVGDTMQIGTNSFTIAGFLRDSQMNSMMASSKRFLVSRADYEKLKAEGSEEYLIEFLLKEGANVGAFAAEYTNAGLPSNGPAITKPLIRMMNALSDGLMVLVILLAGVVLLLISMLCIRFALLTQLEADRREIRVLKAIGISRQDIQQIYFLKFLALSAAGAVTGLFAAALAEGPLANHMQELYGASENGALGFLAALIGVTLTEGTLLFSVRRTLRQMEKLSAVEALAGGQGGQKEKRTHTISSQYRIVALVIGAGIFMMTLPQNLLSTISSPKFVTYMGIGDGEIRMDIRQTGDILGKTEKVKELLLRDGRVSRYTALLTKSCSVYLADGASLRLHVEQGNHTIFPVTYTLGTAPKEKNQLALSCLCADELGLSVGDTLILTAGETRQEYMVCGIYSDITNGGKTAKAADLPDGGPLMWSVLYVSLKDGVSREQWLSEYGNTLASYGISAKAVDIQKYVADTYGQTLSGIRMAARIAVLSAALVIFAVVALFTRLLVEKDRYDISLRKAIGFTGREIRRIYLFRYLPVELAGILAGVLAGNLLGGKIAGLFLHTLGASGFRFLVDYRVAGIVLPGIAFLTASCAGFLGLSEIKNIRAYECCGGKE